MVIPWIIPVPSLLTWIQKACKPFKKIKENNHCGREIFYNNLRLYSQDLQYAKNYLILFQIMNHNKKVHKWNTSVSSYRRNQSTVVQVHWLMNDNKKVDTIKFTEMKYICFIPKKPIHFKFIDLNAQSRFILLNMV